MKLNHHAALRAIGGTLNMQHTCKEREYWTLPESLEDKPDFYDIRGTIQFHNLLSGFRPGGFIIYLNKPIVSDTLAAASDLLAALESLFEQCAMVHKHWGDGSNGKQAAAAIAAGRASIARARGI